MTQTEAERQWYERKMLDPKVAEERREKARQWRRREKIKRQQASALLRLRIMCV